MKQKAKLSIIIIILVVFVITTFSVILLNRVSAVSINLHLDAADRLASQQAESLQGKINGCISDLEMLAQVISLYEQFPAAERRGFVDKIQYSYMLKDNTILQLYVVFKPNALDGRDSEYFGGLGGVAANGQYALLYSAETSILRKSTVPSGELSNIMDHINGPSATRARIENPFMAELGGINLAAARFTVPIINADEVVGAVGMLLDLRGIQSTVTQIIRENEEISSMAVYARNGFIIGSLWQDRVGRMMKDVETGYGRQIDSVVQAVSRGEDFYLNEYVPALHTNIEMILKSFEIGDSGNTWTVMIGIEEAYMLKEAHDIARFTIMLAVLFIMLTVIIVVFVVPAFVKENV